MTKRRTKEEGSVYRRKDGRVVGEYEDANGRKRYITSTSKTKQEMKAAVRKALEERDKGIAYEAQNLTVERYMDRWLESIRDKVRPEQEKVSSITSISHVRSIAVGSEYRP